MKNFVKASVVVGLVASGCHRDVRTTEHPEYAQAEHPQQTQTTEYPQQHVERQHTETRYEEMGNGQASNVETTTTEQTETNATNTERNVRDRDSSRLTPGDQGENETDLTITQKIRQEVMRLNDLSFNAKNIKIITVDGVVTLQGPVENQTEKARIATIARHVEGVRRVDNQLEI